MKLELALGPIVGTLLVLTFSVVVWVAESVVTVLVTVIVPVVVGVLVE